MKKTTKNKTKKPDSNLALVSVILGALSIFAFLLVLTGIPAIITGIIALRKNAGNRTQAKLGILFGTIGCLLLIPIILIAVHFLREPFNEQFQIDTTNRTQIMDIAESLRKYKKQNGKYPLCDSYQSTTSCSEWDTFTSQYPSIAKYPMAFEADPFSVEDRSVGTLVYVNRSACFLNVPTSPSYVDEEEKRSDPTKFASLVYFHDKGRACFDVDPDDL